MLYQTVLPFCKGPCLALPCPARKGLNGPLTPESSQRLGSGRQKQIISGRSKGLPHGPSLLLLSLPDAE